MFAKICSASFAFVLSFKLLPLGSLPWPWNFYKLNTWFQHWPSPKFNKGGGFLSAILPISWSIWFLTFQSPCNRGPIFCWRQTFGLRMGDGNTTEEAPGTDCYLLATTGLDRFPPSMSQKPTQKLISMFLSIGFSLDTVSTSGFGSHAKCFPSSSIPRSLLGKP